VTIGRCECDPVAGQEIEGPDHRQTKLAAAKFGFATTPSRLPTIAGATFITVVLGLHWRSVRYGVAFPFWGDEAYVAVNLLTRDLAGSSRPLEFFQIAPPTASSPLTEA
jgi:hypothetical protein